MTRFLARRLLNYIVLLALASFLTFTLTSYTFTPLNSLLQRNPRPPQAVIDAKAAELDLDKPVPLRYAHWVSGAVRGDFGGDFLMNMGPDDVFVALVEYDRSSAGTPLFDHVGPRTIHGGAFERENMHRPIQGQSGHQQFYSVGGRAFCLYVAIGSHRRRDRLSRAAAMVAATIAIDPAD